MRAEPQAASYRPDTPIETLADWIGDAVEPADFPKTELRFRNERHAATARWIRRTKEEMVVGAGWTTAAFRPTQTRLSAERGANH